MKTMNGLLIFVSNVIHTSTRYSLDSTDVALDQNDICHRVLEWNPQGRRSHGRPKATWRRTVLAEYVKYHLANYELKPEIAIDGS
jgi:hypothetical protein